MKRGSMHIMFTDSMETEREGKITIIRSLARVLGVIPAGFFLFMAIGESFFQSHTLGGHLKTGQSGSPQNRPVRRTQDNLFFTLPMAVVARCFLIGI